METDSSWDRWCNRRTQEIKKRYKTLYPKKNECNEEEYAFIQEVERMFGILVCKQWLDEE